MVMPPNHGARNAFVKLLEREYQRRLAVNPRYSYRAFAYMLGIDAPTLHHILKGHRRTAAKRQRRLLKALGYAEESVERLVREFLLETQKIGGDVN